MIYSTRNTLAHTRAASFGGSVAVDYRIAPVSR